MLGTQLLQVLDAYQNCLFRSARLYVTPNDRQVSILNATDKIQSEMTDMADLAAPVSGKIV